MMAMTKIFFRAFPLLPLELGTILLPWSLYLDIMDKWEIEKLTGFSREGKKLKDYVVDLPKE